MTPGDDDSDDRVVGVIEDDSRSLGTQPTVFEALSQADDYAYTTGTLEALGESCPPLVLAVGPDQLAALARVGYDGLVLPVAIDGVEAASLDTLKPSLQKAFTAPDVWRLPVLGIETERNRARAVFDVTLVTDEPAKISEYALSSQHAPVSQFRADGVVIATPAGSHGYAHTVDGPLVAHDIDGLAVVPIAPFVTQSNCWVLPSDHLELSVIRDESAVSLRVDGTPVETLSVGGWVTIERVGSIRAVQPAGRQDSA